MKQAFFLAILLLVAFGCELRLPAKCELEIRIPDDVPQVGMLLDSVYDEDQKHRDQIAEIHTKYGRNSDELKNVGKAMKIADACNLAIVSQILDHHGWLGPDAIGDKANATLFLVIQHAPQETQENYLPMMRKAVNEGKAVAADLALLEDRVSIGRDEMQIYGSQIGTDPKTGEHYLLPLQEPEKVNERRAQVGLGPIEEYLAHWGLEWNVEEYKKTLEN